MFDAKTRAEIDKIADRLSVPAAALMAVAEVESGGKVLAKVNDVSEPLIRFEGHYFYRHLRGDALDEARKAGLANRIPGAVKNPRSQKNRWVLLNKAIAINRIAALSSCSWGVGQVMGANWKWLGYGSVDALVAEARSGVAGQVALMARYIDKAKLCDALRKQDWAHFAKVYNGPAYARNRYDTKMAQAYAVYNGNTVPVLPIAQREDEAEKLMFGARGPLVKTLQENLSAKGYTLVADGLFGLITDRIVRQFQRDHLLEETGIVGRVEKRLLSGGVGMVKHQVVLQGKSSGKAVKMGSVNLFESVKKTTRRLRSRLLSISRRFA